MFISKATILTGLCLLTLLSAGCNPLANNKTGAGVAKTTNGGLDWTFVNKSPLDTAKKNAKQQDSALATSSVVSMKFVPGSSAGILVATQDNGLFLTKDNASTWVRILPDFSAYDVAVVPDNPEHIFVVGQSNEQARVVNSLDGGKTWLSVYNDATPGQVARSIAFEPGTPKTIIVGLGSGNLVRSLDGGVSWSLLQNFQDSVSQLLWQTKDILYILTRTKGLYVSFDGGVTVQNITKQLLNISQWREQLSSVLDNDRTNTGKLNVPTTETTAFYKLAVTEGGVGKQIFIGANNGLFRSGNGGTSWEFLQLPLKSTQATEVRGLGLQNGGKTIFASVGNTVFKTTNAGSSWQVTAIATSTIINYILMDPQFEQVVYVGFIPAQ